VYACVGRNATANWEAREDRETERGEEGNKRTQKTREPTAKTKQKPQKKEKQRTGMRTKKMRNGAAHMMRVWGGVGGRAVAGIYKVPFDILRENRQSQKKKKKKVSSTSWVDRVKNSRIVG
jgi:hypothetical protein